jgi:hypothetical protein
MKKIYLSLIAIIFIINYSFAQWTTSGTNIYYNSGNVGIGTPSPAEILTLGSETPGTGRKVLRISAGSYAEPGPINTASSGDKIILYDATGSLYDGRIGIGDRANFWMKSLSSAGSNYGSFEWYVGNNSGNPQMLLSGTGALSIGTINANGYQLAVNGSAIATSVTVKAYANWPDYVFNKNYPLPSLTEIKTYIDQNHHLPEIPSEQQIEKDGLNLGEMNKLLVKKVEELTLYLIEKDKQLKEQQVQINQLKHAADNNSEQAKELAALKAQVQLLIQQVNNK